MAKKHEGAPEPEAPLAADPPTYPAVPLSDQIDSQIAVLESELANLRAQKAALAVAQYPKVRYHATLAPVTVADAHEEAEKAADGYTLDGPPAKVEEAN